MRRLATLWHTAFPSDPALVKLSARFSGGCMLPNLRKLDWDNAYGRGDITLDLPLLISPSLATIKLILKDIPLEQATAPLKDISHEQATVPLEDIPHEQATAPLEDIPHEQATAPLEDISLEQAIAPLEDISHEQATAPLEDIPHEQATAPLEDIPHEQATAPLEDISLEQAIAPLEDISHEQATAPLEDISHEQAITPLKDTSHEQAITPLKDTSREQAIVPLLAPAYESLRSIYIDWDGSGPVQDFSALLFKCDKLQKFNMDSPVRWKAFLRASQLPNLRHWTIQPDSMEPPSDASLPTTMFPSLKSLLIKGINTDSIWLRSLERIYSKSLESLVLDLESPATAKAVLPMAFKYLRSSGLHQTLTKFTIYPQGNFLDVDERTIENLPLFNRLTMLEVSFVCSPNECDYKISDEVLERLVKAIPNLESLILGSALCSRPADNSIKSLVAIAKHCKRLEQLVIHTNVEAVISGRNYYPGEDPILGGPALVGCPLRSIAIGRYSVLGEKENAKKFASVLLWLFPHLIEVGTVGASPGEVSVTECIADLRGAQAGKFVGSCHA
jgi:hypothetical protein